MKRTKVCSACYEHRDITFAYRHRLEDEGIQIGQSIIEMTAALQEVSRVFYERF